MLHAVVAPSLPASGVTHSVVGNFSGGDADGGRELILFRKNNVELWRVPCGAGKRPALSYVTSMQLNAPPVSVATCRPLGFAVDVIVMCFDDFHVSFVQYNPIVMRFHTLALVQLDDREVAHNVTPLEPVMRADPAGRFVAVLARRRHMFLIPLLGLKRRDDDDDDNGALDGIDKDGNGNGKGRDGEKENNNNNNNKLPETLAPTDDWGDEDDYKEALTEEAEKPKSPEKQQVMRETLSEPHDSKVIDASNNLLRVGVISMFALAKLVKGSIRYVRDMQFIESSGEPIVAFLCERQPTWAGRLKLVEWRTKMVESNMLSLQVIWVQISPTSTVDQRLLLIGEVDNIPYNVTHMTPVGSFGQAPSGVVCYGINTVMHVTTKRGYGVYFNEGGAEECAGSKSSAMSFGKAGWLNAQMETSTDLFRVNLSLANCAAAPMSVKGGMLQLLAASEEDGVVLTLQFTAQGSMVQCIEMGILGIGCYCSTISPIGDKVVFLGSARSDSCVAAIDCFHDEASQRFQIIETMEAIGFIADVDAVDCTSNVGNEKRQRNATQTSWLDGMPYAQLLRSTMVDPMPSVPIMESRNVMDLAVCAGYAKSGSIFVLRKSVRNNVVQREKVNAVSAFFLESIHSNKRLRVEHEEDGGVARGSSHLPLSPSLPHLLLTGLSFTIPFVLRGESVQHIRRSEFLTSCRTVFAATLPWLDALLQVTEREGRIISFDGKSLLHKFYFVSEREVERRRFAKAASIAAESQLLFVLLEDGTLLKFSLKSAQAVVSTKKVFAEGVTAFALWREPQRVVMFDTEGTMTISEMDTNNVYAKFPHFGTLPPHSVFGASESTSNGRDGEPLPLVTHVEVVTWRDDVGEEAIALVVILATDELAVYRVMASDVFGPLRLIKSIHHFLHNKAEREVIESIEMKKQRLQRERGIIENDTQMVRHCSRRIIPFDAIGGNAGVYVCGQHPLFLFWDSRLRQLVAYSHQTPGPVRGFVPFSPLHNGYIYCCEGFVDFASMNTYCQPNGHGWLTRRIHLGATPHFVVYHPPAQGCFVVTSRKEPFRPQRSPFDVQLKIVYDEEHGGIQSITTESPVCNLPPIAPDAGVRVPMVDRFEIHFMSTVEWTSKDTLLLEENERVLSAQMIEIYCENNLKDSKTVPVCVVSTAFPLGEDVTCRGRILVLASTEVDGERKIHLLHSEPLNGPATALVGIQNHIAVAVGGSIKIFRYDWETRKMVVSALLYAGMYVTRMSVFRNYLIYGDLFRSCAMARFNEENHTLNVLGKDRNMVSVVHCEMMYHDRAFGILCSDDQRNLLVMGYTPRLQETEAGKPNKVLESVLSLDGEYRLPSGCLVKSLRFRSFAGNSSVTLYVTNYGEVGFIVPIGEQANRTALWVTRRLQMDLSHEAGLTPRMFLGLSQGSPRTALRAKELLISGSLLKQFFFLDICSRRAIATAAYTQLGRVTNVAALVDEECTIF